MNEFDVLKRNLPLKEHLPKYLCVKTKINTFDDYEFRLELGLDKTVRKFSHTGWTEMKPLVVGIKCYTRDGTNAFVYVRHCDRKKENCQIIDEFDVKNEEWHQFKFPLMANYHTDTRILMSENVSAYTLAILDVSTRVRHELVLEVQIQIQDVRVRYDLFHRCSQLYAEHHWFDTSSQVDLVTHL